MQCLGRGVAERVGHEVDGLCCVLGEHELIGGCTQERRDALACALVGVGGLLGQQMRTAVHCGVVARVEATLRIEHREWLLRRSARVEVDEPISPAHSARENREVGRDPLDVEQPGHGCVHCGHAEDAALT